MYIGKKLNIYQLTANACQEGFKNIYGAYAIVQFIWQPVQIGKLSFESLKMYFFDSLFTANFTLESFTVSLLTTCQFRDQQIFEYGKVNIAAKL